MQFNKSLCTEEEYHQKVVVLEVPKSLQFSICCLTMPSCSTFTSIHSIGLVHFPVDAYMDHLRLITFGPHAIVAIADLF